VGGVGVLGGGWGGWGGGGGGGGGGADDEDDTPCYRCLFPDPPAPEYCSRCAEAGVLGPVPGVMGVLQALEALKLLAGEAAGSGGSNNSSAVVGEPLVRRMLLYDALSARFTTVKLRGRRDDCVACGRASSAQAAATAAEAAAADASAPGRLRRPGAVAETDYTAFTGQSADDALPPPLALIPENERITAPELARWMRGGDERSSGPPAAAAPIVVLDVRPRAQFDVMALRGAVNVPFSELDRRWAEVEALARMPSGGGGDDDEAACPPPPGGVVVVVCRRGNHSQLCARRLRAALVASGLGEHEAKARVRDLVGGYEAWAASCEAHVPVL